ncbi:MAG: TonB-dependent receptor [Pseudomonadaceae bacterium]|nr:TonB-dependent receptor [Pseudomonadaceae bacterium]
MSHTKRKFGWLHLSPVLLLPMFFIASIAQAEAVIEEVIVTGSFIKGTPEDAALPVDVLTRAELEDVGNPSIIEMVRNLGVTSANAGEANQFASVGQAAGAGVSLINLRGLGAERTLVLINGKRHVSTTTLGVDVSAIPASAIGRVEVLKDGAAALYGSDAIGGVVNFITRNNFEGLELRASNQFIDDAGDQNIAAIWGFGGERWNMTLSGEYDHRDELTVRDRDWAAPTFAENSQAGYSSIGNPGTFLPAVNPTGGTNTLLGGFTPDPGCETVGATLAAPFCRFQFTLFDNLIEDTDYYKFFSTLDFEIDDTTTLTFEAMYSEVIVDDRLTSPSYPPQSLLGPDRFVPSTHPGLIALKAANPGLFSDVAGIPAADQGAVSWSRMVGYSGLNGESETGPRETETLRLNMALEGIAFGELNYEFALSYSNRERFSGTNDMYVERMAFAFEGLGGAGCDPATGVPGVGPCVYYNPFSNAIERSILTGANPDFDPSVANSPELFDWLTDRLDSEARNELFVFDAIFSGDTDVELGGGTIGWAAGFQSRRERYQLDLNDVANLAVNPCPFVDPFSVTLGHTASLDCTGSETGLFAFLSGTREERTKRTVYGLFAELALPWSDRLDMQAAIRYEDYGGEVGSTLDPKIAARFQVNDWIALRGSASTTFRGPPQAILGGTGTALAFVGPATAFKAIDTVGNPNLEPETATALNFGVIVDTGKFYGSIDYWNFEFDDPLQVESFGNIISAYAANGCEDGGTGAATSTCAGLRAQVFPLGTPAAGVERIVRNWVNGATINTSGIDFLAQYTFELGEGELTAGIEGTYTLELEAEDQIAAGVVVAPEQDYAGRLNDINSFFPLPELKGNLNVKYINGRHTLTYLMRYVDSYEDQGPANSSLAKIDDHITHDLHYNVEITDSVRVSLSAINLLDEDPPAASLDLNYDPLTHNAFGRMIKLGIVYTPFSN